VPASEIRRVEYSQKVKTPSTHHENIIRTPTKMRVYLLVRIPREPTDMGDLIADAVEEVPIFLFGFTRVLVQDDSD
jgi:hypothetical protein